MKDINLYIIEKLHLNKDIEIESADADTFTEFFTNLMKECGYWANEFNIEIDGQELSIKFLIDVSVPDYTDTFRQLRGMLQEKNMLDNFEMHPNSRQNKIDITIRKNEKH